MHDQVLSATRCSYVRYRGTLGHSTTHLICMTLCSQNQSVCFQNYGCTVLHVNHLEEILKLVFPAYLRTISELN